jgi:RNA-directed DNA polymerase
VHALIRRCRHEQGGAVVNFERVYRIMTALDELDRELELRSHRFVRYADDCDISFLGFTVKDDPGFRRCIADKAVTRFKDRVRELTRRHRGVSLEAMVADLSPFVRDGPGASASAIGASCRRWMAGSDDAHVAPRGFSGRRPINAIASSDALTSPKSRPGAAIFSPKGRWRLSSSEALHRAFTKARFRRLGLVSMEKLVSARPTVTLLMVRRARR